MFPLIFARHIPRGAVLTIIDGFGESAWPQGNGIQDAKTPNLDYLKSHYIYTPLVAAQQPVGLIRGEPGSSSVGHQTLGLGRITPSYYQKLESSMNPKSENYIKNNEVLKETIQHAKKNNGRVHFAGLCTDWGIFSHIKFLPPLFEAAADQNVSEILVHCFFTHADPNPSRFLRKIEEGFPKNIKARFATISSQLTSLDKFKRWGLSNVTAQAIIAGTAKTIKASDIYSEIDKLQAKGIDYDPFILTPTEDAHLKSGDSIIFFNHREEQSLQVATLVMKGVNLPKNVKTTPMILYHPSLKEFEPILPSITYKNSLGSWLSQKGYRQIRIAEQYKKDHITTFFSGGITQPKFEGEEDVINFTSKSETIVENFPEMNASLIFDTVEKAIKSEKYKLVAVNFANCDATGHSGNNTAVRLAVEYIDKIILKIFELCKAHDYALFITSDHGNAEENTNLDGTRQIGHTVNNVPFITTASGVKLAPQKTGKVPYIGNVAASILHVLDIEPPPEMDPSILIDSVPSCNQKRIIIGLLAGFTIGVCSIVVIVTLMPFIKHIMSDSCRKPGEPRVQV